MVAHLCATIVATCRVKNLPKLSPKYPGGDKLAQMIDFKEKTPVFGLLALSKVEHRRFGADFGLETRVVTGL